jgi:hypothetical protein
LRSTPNRTEIASKSQSRSLERNLPSIVPKG